MRKIIIGLSFLLCSLQVLAAGSVNEGITCIYKNTTVKAQFDDSRGNHEVNVVVGSTAKNAVRKTTAQAAAAIKTVVMNITKPSMTGPSAWPAVVRADLKLEKFSCSAGPVNTH
ncbi:MAG: hypothetical protein H7A09_11010 [Oceanospirillaceae bacterium]|nr:hypothetical protein [Oceanospirillaceae bacterium]